MHHSHLYVSVLADLIGAAPPTPKPATTYTLPQVIDSATNWVLGIIAAVATLFLVIGGLRYITAAGDPAAVEQAKGSLKAAATGYALAVLAYPLLDVLRGILGVKGS
jgi:hypothetical protein